MDRCEQWSAKGLVWRMRAGWCLGNTLDAMVRNAQPGIPVAPEEAETAWFNPPTTRRLMACVREAGFGAVRIPVTWWQHMDPDGQVDPAWMDRVAEIAGWVRSEGMIALVNIHHDAGPDAWLRATTDCWERQRDRFTLLVRQIAERFRDWDEDLVLESVNEMLDGQNAWTRPREEGAFDIHNAFAQRFVDTVRETGGNNAQRALSLQTYSAGSVPATLAGFATPRDSAPDGLILQVHNYDPEGFCWQRAEGRVMRDDWGTDADLAETEAFFARIAAFGEREDRPVMVGEFGSMNKDNTPARARHAAWFAGCGRRCGIPAFWWDCGQFSLFNRRCCELVQPKIAAALTGRG